MADRGRTAVHNDSSRPPIFSPDEWNKIVRKLSLSPRQGEVVGLVMQSKTDVEIGIALQVGKSTIRKHIRASMTRLGTDDRMGLAYRVFTTFRQIIEVKDVSLASVNGHLTIARSAR